MSLGASARRKSELQVLELSKDWLEEVFELEQLCSQNPWSKQVLTRELERDFSLRLGLVSESSLIAQCFCYLVVDELHILNISVRPEFQGHGFGRHLLQMVLETGRKKGADTAILEVRVSNSKARSLYESLHFESVGVRSSYYRNNGEDALLLEKSLKNWASKRPQRLV